MFFTGMPGLPRGGGGGNNYRGLGGGNDGILVGLIALWILIPSIACAAIMIIQLGVEGTFVEALSAGIKAWADTFFGIFALMMVMAVGWLIVLKIRGR